MPCKRYSVSFFVFFFLICQSLNAAETAKELFQEGAAFYKSGNYDKAIESLEKSIKLDPNFAPAYNTLGLAYRETNANLKEVIWYFKSAVEIDPQYTEAFDNLGKAYYNMGQFDKAIEYCKKALELNPNYGPAQFSLAWVYLLGKSMPQEAIYYFKIIAERTKIPNAYFGLGMAYFMVDDRAMTLDVITTLRGMGQEQLAEQLENMIRDYYYIQNEGGGSLVKIEPPPEEPALNPPVPERGIQPPPSENVGGGVTRVRMQGTFFNVAEEEEKNKAKAASAPPQPQTISTTKGSALVQSSASVQANVPETPKKDTKLRTTVISPTKNQDSLGTSRRTIEIEGSGGY